MKIDYEKIVHHKQLTNISCIPMSVELVLKAISIMDPLNFDIQMDSTKSRNSLWIKNGFAYPKDKPLVIFSREFCLSDVGLPDRGDHFIESYYDSLFSTIDSELNANRFVIISLSSGLNKWHMIVIFEKRSDNSYETITFYHNISNYVIEVKDLRKIVYDMKGTDIFTYKWV